MRNTLLQFLVLLLICTGLTGYGSNINTANLSYECLGNDEYRINLELFVECVPGDNSIGSQEVLPFFYESEKLGVSSKSIILTKDASQFGIWQPLRCQNNVTNTSCTNNGKERGVFKYVYSGILNLGEYKPTDDWLLYFQKNSRAALNDLKITTLNIPFYASTILNTMTNSCNNSVKTSGMSIFKACIDKTEEFDLNLSDSDGNELRFRFENPKFSVTNNLIYEATYTELRPISMNDDLKIENGKLIVSANKLNEIGITTLVIEEWKDGEKIGETLKDIQIQSFDCSNTPPILSDFPNNTTHVQVCVGSVLDVGLTKDDAENNSTFFVKTAPFNIFNTTSGKFSWTPNNNHIGTHTFEIGVRDDACPYFAETIKTFTIEVTRLPTFDLGTHSVLNCNTGINYNPTIVGNEPYHYKWSSRSNKVNSTAPNLFINNLDTIKIDTFDLVVTDKFGCVNRDFVTLSHPIQANFTPIKRCFKDSSTFNNQTKIIDKSTITSYDWSFENTKSGIANSDKKSPIVLFPNTGTYKTTLTVKNSSGCSDTYIYDVQICDHPRDVAYIRLDSCSLERYDGHGGVPFVDITNYTETPCGKDSVYFNLFDMNNLDTLTSSLNNRFKYNENYQGIRSIKFKKEGIYKLEMITVTEAKCIDTFTTKFTIHPRPTIALKQNGIHLNCNKPDTTLTAILDSIEVGTGDLTYEWKKDGIIIPTDKQFFVRDSSWTTVNELGNYTINIVDSLNCSHMRNISIVYPLYAKFKYSQVCKPTDVMKFTEIANSFFKIVEWKWNVGDGTEKINTNIKTYEHKYTNPNDYEVTLSLKDSTGCTASISNIVYNTFPIDTFSIKPVLAKGFCQNGKLLAKGNYPDPTFLAEGKSHIDTIRWNWNGRQFIYSNADSKSGHLPLNEGYVITNQIVPKGIDSLKVVYEINYNKHPEMEIYTSCTRTLKSVSYPINEEINGTFIVGGNCTKDTLNFKFNPTSSAEITSWKWTVKERFTENVLFTSDSYNPKKYISKELANKNYDIYFETTDENGCSNNYNNQPVKTTTINNVDPTILSFDKDSICLGNSVQITATEPNKNKAKSANTYYLLNTTTNDTLINGFFKFKATPNGVPFLKQYTPPFLQEGINTVSLYLAYVNPIDSTSCGAYSFDTIMVYPSPTLAFTYSSVCAKDTIQLTNNSSINTKLDEITSYKWKLPDGSTTSDKNPKFTFNKGGANSISLQVTTKFGCLNKKGNKLDSTIYFYHTPIADFTVDSDVLEAYMDLPFESTSYVDGEGEEIKISTFDLGDGTFVTGESFTHSYQKVDIYPVTHKVITNKGCQAEITKKINLNTYLDIATVFTPNKDGKNDDFGLIYKEIKELIEYKIYNRWGELVFDGGNNADARWDGTFRGKDQEVGVYILYIKAKGAYNQEYNFKENITLLR